MQQLIDSKAKVINLSLGGTHSKAVDEAVKDCIQKNILKDVLSEERSAVMLEMLTTFDEKLYAEGLREEGREEMRIEKDKEIAAKDAELNAKDAELKRVLDWARAHGYKE